MIRNLLATTAIATLLASGAYAQSGTTTTDPAMAPSGGMTDGATAPVEEAVEPADGHLASNLIGENVYNGTQDDAENIGSVKDIVIGLDGQAQMLVVGVGGFLGIGQKDISVPYGEVEWAQREDGSTWLVVNASRESLEQQEEFNADAYEPALVVGSSQGEDASGGASEDMAADEGATTDEGASQDMAAEEGATAEDGTTEEMVAVEDAPAEEDASGDMAADEGATTEEGASQDMAASADSSTDQGASGDMAASGDSSTDQTASDDMAASDSASTEEGASDDMAASDSASTEESASGDMAADEGATTEEGASEDMAATEGDAAGTDDTATAAIDPASLSEVDSANLSAEQLIGTTVYGANEENVGEISDVILSEEGQVEAVTMDVGGFLGIGEKQVAVSMENLAFMSDESDDLYLYTSFTQEQLEAQPEYDEATFAEQRDEQLLMNEMN